MAATELIPDHVPLDVMLNKLALTQQIRSSVDGSGDHIHFEPNILREEPSSPRGLLVDSWAVPLRNSFKWHKNNNCLRHKPGIQSVLICSLENYSNGPDNCGFASKSLIIIRGEPKKSPFTMVNVLKIAKHLDYSQLLYISKYEAHVFVDVSFNASFWNDLERVEDMDDSQTEIRRPILYYMDQSKNLYHARVSYNNINGICQIPYDFSVTICFDTRRNEFPDEIGIEHGYEGIINRQREHTDVIAPRPVSIRTETVAPVFGETNDNLLVTQPSDNREQDLSLDQTTSYEPSFQSFQATQQSPYYQWRDAQRHHTAAYGAYVTPEQRKASFVGRWPHPGYLQNVDDMVKYGFFFTGTGDLIRCHQCGIGLKDWSCGDNPLTEHVRHASDCRFLSETLPPTLLAYTKASTLPNNTSSTRESVIAGATPSNALSGSADEVTLPIQPRSPQYRQKSVRLSSFSKWPPHIQQTPGELAEAGFYYTGCGDIVRCFVCDGGLQKWSPEDNAWVEHARWFPHCAYVRHIKGEDFIELVGLSAEHAQLEEEGSVGNTGGNNGETNDVFTCWNNDFNTPEKHEVLKPDEFSKQENQEQNPSKQETQSMAQLIEETGKLRSIVKCLTCEEADANCLYLPCAHHRLCIQCSANVVICPMCGKRVHHKVKTYMS